MECLSELTPRQLEVLAHYASGLTGPEISKQVYLSPHTIRNYLKAAKKRTGARSLAQIVAWLVSAQILYVKSDGAVSVSVSVRRNDELK